MSFSKHLEFSEEDVEAAEVLDELRKTIPKKDPNIPIQTNVVIQQENDKNRQEKHNENANENLREGSANLLDRVMTNVATFYANRKRVASVARLLDDAYEDNYTTSESEVDTDLSESEIENVTGDENKNDMKNQVDKKRPYDVGSSGNTANYNPVGNVGAEQFENGPPKRQKISGAIDNFKEYKFNMSIESKKRLFACLHLLKLANKQLSEKITNLQDLVQKEHEAYYRYQLKLNRSQLEGKKTYNKKPSISSLINSNDNNNDDINEKKENKNKKEEEGKENNNSNENSESVLKMENQKNNDNESGDGGGSKKHENEEFFDTFDTKENNEQATIIKMEVIGTIKKVYSMVSRFTGSSLPEPARSQVRASLLNLPTKWYSRISNLSSSNSSLPGNNLLKDPMPTSGNHYISTNGKVLILAKESLDMVQNVMEVVDSTLGKAEDWVKQKQEVKEALYEKFMQAKNREKG